MLASILNAFLLENCKFDAMIVSQMSIQNTTPNPQQRQHRLSEQALLGTHAARNASGASLFFRAGVRTVAARLFESQKAGDGPPPAPAHPSDLPHSPPF